MIKYPTPLKINDSIGITAPSSGVSGVFSERLDYSIDSFEKWGYKCIETESVRKCK